MANMMTSRIKRKFDSLSDLHYGIVESINRKNSEMAQSLGDKLVDKMEALQNVEMLKENEKLKERNEKLLMKVSKLELLLKQHHYEMKELRSVQKFEKSVE